MNVRAVFERHGRQSLAAPAEPAPAADRPSVPPGESAAVRAMRRRLSILAESEGVSLALVNSLADHGVEECLGMSDWELCSHLAMLDRAARMDAGFVPRGWNRAGQCRTCGPVYLPADHPADASPCPWCRITRSGADFIRPPVRCGDCQHFNRSRFNPEAGMGTCALGRVRRFAPPPYPHVTRLCRFFRPVEPTVAVAGAPDGDYGREVGRAAEGVLGSSPSATPAGNSDPDGCSHSGMAVQLTGSETE